MDYPVIDSHQHFWKYDPDRDTWITEGMDILKRDFLPADLEPLLKANKVDGCVAVQASESEMETEFLLDLAGRYPFIRAVVGWVDLESDGLEHRLRHYSKTSVLKGFRPMLQSDPQRDKMLQPAFRNGIALLQQYHFTCDLIIRPDQLAFAAELAASYPSMKFVIDHLGKPALKRGNISDWKKDISRFRHLENVFCKISGMVTEADWLHWKKTDLMPVVDHVTETFGTSRIMFGSDWPVCLLAAGYRDVKEVLDGYFSPADQQKFFSGNALSFYSIT